MSARIIPNYGDLIDHDMELKQSHIHPKITPHLKTPEQKHLFGLLAGWFDNPSLEVTFNLTDSEAFIQLLKRHRMHMHAYNLCVQNVSEPSKHIINPLKDVYLQSLKRGLVIGEELKRLAEGFEKEALPVVFLKGPPLSLRIYNNLFLRPGVDLDVFVTPKDYSRAMDTCAALGYIAKDNKGIKNNPEYKVKDRVLVHAQHKTQLELHHRLYFNPVLENRFRSSHIPKVSMSVAGQKVQIFNDDAHFLYLVTHGAMHQYFRIFWLHDIAAYLKSGLLGTMQLLQKKASSRGVLLHLYISLTLIEWIYHFKPTDFEPIDPKSYKKSQLLAAEILPFMIRPIHETIFVRLRRLSFFLKLTPDFTSAFHTLKGAFFRFLG